MRRVTRLLPLLSSWLLSTLHRKLLRRKVSVVGDTFEVGRPLVQPGDLPKAAGFFCVLWGRLRLLLFTDCPVETIGL